MNIREEKERIDIGRVNLLANSGLDVASTLSSSNLLAFLCWVGLRGGSLANTDFVASGLSGASLGSSSGSHATDLSGLDEGASVGAARASLA